MGFKVGLRDPATGEIARLSHGPKYLRESMYMVGGYDRATIDIAYDYGPFFYRFLGPKGLRVLHGRSGAETQRLLATAINAMTGEPDQDYWAATEGNAKAALEALLKLAQAVPQGIWEGLE